MEAPVRTIMLALACTLVAGNAHAISRYNSQSMSCAEVRGTLQSEGAAIMRYRSARSGLPLYGRYVYTTFYCAAGEYAERKFIPTADDPSCPVRECEHYDFDDFVPLRRR
jgi:hypothetical protein